MMAIEISKNVERLIASNDGHPDPSWETHLRRHGPLPSPLSRSWDRGLLEEIERSGLTGRGGAGFPAYRKARLAQTNEHLILVVNAMEGEPASAKDRILVASSVQLVLDGAEVLANALCANQIVLCAPEEPNAMANCLVRALADRRAHVPLSISTVVRRLPAAYVAGEESALASGVAGDRGLPKNRPDKSVPLRIGREAALVHNVETLAQVALIARHGADWFRDVGSLDAPGTCLVTISGGVERPGVLEVATGTPVTEILELSRPIGRIQAILVGGYGGTWLARADADVAFAPGALADVGASMGAGVLVALPVDSCGIRETARIASFMASESAGQCGPCFFGLPAIADDLRGLALGTADRGTLDRLRSRCDVVVGRGACRHPDGVVRLVRSALDVFADDVNSHARGVPCAGTRRLSVLTGRRSIKGRR